MTQPLTYYIDNPQIHELIRFAGGDRFPSWTPSDLWDFATVLSAELANSGPSDNFVRMSETVEALNLSFCPVCKKALEIVDGISRRDAKLLLMGMTAIASYSDIH